VSSYKYPIGNCYESFYMSRTRFKDAVNSLYGVYSTKENGISFMKTNLVIHCIHQGNLPIQFLMITDDHRNSIQYTCHRITRKEEHDATSFISASMFFRVSSHSPIITKPSSCTISLPRRGLVRQKFLHLVEAQNENKEKIVQIIKNLPASFYASHISDKICLILLSP
jgi:hypothetical protein